MEGAGHQQQSHFLDFCFLCRKRIARNCDIYMYKGNIPFCTEECRNVCIEADEAIERAELARAANKRPTREPSPGRDVDVPKECGKIRTGSVLAL